LASVTPLRSASAMPSGVISDTERLNSLFISFFSQWERSDPETSVLREKSVVPLRALPARVLEASFKATLFPVTRQVRSDFDSRSA